MVTKCDQVSGLLSKVKTLLPLWSTLREYNVIVGQNARDQITQTSGGSRVRARRTRPLPPLIFRPNWGLKGQKIFLGDRAPSLSQVLDDPPPPPPITWRPESATANASRIAFIVSEDLNERWLHAGSWSPAIKFYWMVFWIFVKTMF